jgi:hypothetical protein
MSNSADFYLSEGDNEHITSISFDKMCFPYFIGAKIYLTLSNQSFERNTKKYQIVDIQFSHSQGLSGFSNAMEIYIKEIE